ncbi:alsin-like [Physella acuta]|uniref:alsin-like n=1 Tax=Physella acuta TaxID=109671 RepID=UPI0027DB39AE|nr:alsin-like [Physella acuta]
MQGSIRDLSDEKDKTTGASTLFMRAMRYPFFRVADYSRILEKMKLSSQRPEVKDQLQNLIYEWDSVKLYFSSEHKLAEATRTFWETANPKVADMMKTPTRRMLLDSKTRPLNWPAGGRFSYRQFVLFNDVFLHVQSTAIVVLPLETMWVESSTADTENPNAISIIAPEDRYDLFTATPADKAEWLIALNSAISKVLLTQKSAAIRHSNGERFTPPLIRQASHKFVKPGPYKDATYNGTWLIGKVHGTGSLKYPDGSSYEGEFKKGLKHGSGVNILIKSSGQEIQKGSWRDGKLNGFGTVSYPNGDLYEGYFQEGQRFGHGKFRSGRHKSSFTSIYIGEWLCNQRDGYGVEDDILKGEKYMGLWVEDYRHGNGVMVTLDGMYFEGNFVQSKMTGFGLMISDDNMLYEGDFFGITHLSGKGTLTLATGDKLEGNFNGSLNEGLKINGTFIKSPTPYESEVKLTHPANITSKYFGRLCVPADVKWKDIFSHTESSLGQGHSAQTLTQADTERAWEVVAVMVSAGRKILKDIKGISPSKLKMEEKTLEGLEKIPLHGTEQLTTETITDISVYLCRAFDTIYHPLGKLMETLVDVFRASYIGVGAHPRLLHHAVLEVLSYIRRLYRVVRILFPALPANGGPIHVYPRDRRDHIPRTNGGGQRVYRGAGAGGPGLEQEDPSLQVFTAAGLLYPIMLPKIYPPLFDLYALYNERNDDLYWERVTKLNRQSDMGLLAYLGIEQRFWLLEEILETKTQQLSTVKDVCYAEAVDTLQQLSTAFSPIEKLKIIEQTFNQITKTVTLALKDDHMWCMDDLFPIFQFVVVRAKIHHLGAEIHVIEDLMEPHMEHGEFGLMFTTLKACYFQIQNEKMPHH